MNNFSIAHSNERGYTKITTFFEVFQRNFQPKQIAPFFGMQQPFRGRCVAVRRIKKAPRRNCSERCRHDGCGCMGNRVSSPALLLWGAKGGDRCRRADLSASKFGDGGKQRLSAREQDHFDRFGGIVVCDHSERFIQYAAGKHFYRRCLCREQPAFPH